MLLAVVTLVAARRIRVNLQAQMEKHCDNNSNKFEAGIGRRENVQFWIFHHVWAMPYLYKYVSNKEMNRSQSANHRAFQAGSCKELKYNGAPKEL